MEEKKMIQIDLKNKNNQVVIGKIDHEKKETAFSANGEEIAVLAIKNHTYEVGDKLVITKEKNDHYFVVQLDETLAPTLLYIPEKKWEYVIPLEETKASVETGFRSKRHHIPVVLVNFNILKNISKFLQNVVVLDLIEHCKPVICFQIYSLAL